MGYEPTPVGELAPGSYNVQARLSDIADPTRAPSLHAGDRSRGARCSRRLCGAAQPGAYEPPSSWSAPTRRSTRPRCAPPSPDPRSASTSILLRPVRARVRGGRHSRTLPGLHRAEAFGSYPNVSAPCAPLRAAISVKGTSTVVEYYSDQLDHTSSAHGPTKWPRSMRARVQAHRAALPGLAARRRCARLCHAGMRFLRERPQLAFLYGRSGECQSSSRSSRSRRADANAKGQPFRAGSSRPSLSMPSLRRAARALANDAGLPRVTTTARRRRLEPSLHGLGAMRQAMRQSWVDEGVAFCSPT
jgi:hypothetical protein